MSRDPRIIELREALEMLVQGLRITDEKDEVNVVVEKPVDIEAVDNALLSARHSEPIARLEQRDSWRIRLMKREQERPKELRYQAVRVLDSYYEYRPMLPQG
jgi:hypothetical protein